MRDGTCNPRLQGGPYTYGLGLDDTYIYSPNVIHITIVTVIHRSQRTKGKGTIINKLYYTKSKSTMPCPCLTMALMLLYKKVFTPLSKHSKGGKNKQKNMHGCGIISSSILSCCLAWGELS